MRNTLRNPRFQLLSIAASLTCCMFMAGLSAYLTDKDDFPTILNVATGEEFGIEITGQPFTDEVFPGEVITLSPTITNTGEHDAYVFAEVVMDSDFQIDTNKLAPDWTHLGGNVYYFGSDQEASVLYSGDNNITTPFEDIMYSTDPEYSEGTRTITVNAYAIQTENMTTTDDKGKQVVKSPAELWKLASGMDVPSNESTSSDGATDGDESTSSDGDDIIIDDEGN